MQRFIFITSLLVSFGLGLSAQNQILVNIVNQQQFGSPNAYDWGASVLDASGNYYTVGHTNATGTTASLLLTKQGTDGEVAWQQTFTPSLGTNCYGVGLTTDAGGNIYAIGASKGATGGFDFAVLKYSPAGVKLWHKILAGTANGDDIPTGVVCSPTGSNIFVTGARSGSGGQYDYWTHCLNGANGNTVWSAVYDYAGFNDAPAALRLDSFGNPIVTGVSAASALNWELATVKYNASNGQQLSANRVSNNGIGLYLPSGLDLDGSGNMYVTGTTATSLTEFDIKTVRINSDFTLGWQKTFDAPSTLDSATQVKVTAAGEVYVSGYYRHDQQGIESVLLKYDASGDLKWKKVRTNNTQTAQCRPHRLTLDAMGNAFVAFEITDGGKANIAIVQYTPTGEIKWERTTDRNNGRDLPLNISLGTNGKIYLTDLQKNTAQAQGNKYRTFQVESFSRPLQPVGTDSTHFAKEVLVRFAPGLTNTSFIDNKNLRYGKASQVLNNASVIAEIGQKISSSNFGDWTLIKVHPNMTTADSVRYTPEGRKIIVPDFYNTFLLSIPRDYERIRDEKSFPDTLESRDFQCFIRTSEPNFIVKPDDCVPDDPIYAQQGNLHPTSSYPNGHINCEEAWCIAGGGSSDIKVAIVDSGVRFTHEDYNVESSSGSVVTGGRIYTTGADLLTDPDNDLGDHGTRVASVIGSIRNNATGVAGISGGNDNADGVRLVGLNALASGTAISDLIQAFGDAVDEFGVNIINCSGGTDVLGTNDLELFREKIRHANRMGVVICASRGNGGGSAPRLPGTIQDEWVICVGGTGTTGEYNPECRQGAPIDIAAPSRWQLTRSAQACIPGTGDPTMGIPCTQSDQAYGGISFTSGATPHAAGVAALMMSYYNATSGQTQLTHDDIEYIIQASATDKGATGYDGQTGHGLLNAGAALKMIERPGCNVFHFGSDVNPHTRVTEQVAANIDIVLTEPYTTETGQSFPKGNYKADVWKVTSTVSHPLPNGFTVDHFWPRHSACTTFDLYTTVSGQNRLIPVEKDAIVGTPTGSSAVVTGYVYLLKDNNCVDQGWIPATKEDARLTYSLIGCDPTIATVEVWPDAFRVYPNPANDVLNIDFAGSPAPSGSRLLLMDFSGRILKTVNLATQSELQTIQIGDLPQGVFICQIQMDGKVFSTKFVKM